MWQDWGSKKKLLQDNAIVCTSKFRGYGFVMHFFLDLKF